MCTFKMMEKIGSNEARTSAVFEQTLTTYRCYPLGHETLAVNLVKIIERVLISPYTIYGSWLDFFTIGHDAIARIFYKFI